MGIWVGLLAMAFIIPLRSRFRRRLRIGAMAVFVAETMIFFLKDIPPVPQTAGWYAEAPLLAYSAVAALALYAARLAAGTGAST